MTRHKKIFLGSLFALILLALTGSLCYRWWNVLPDGLMAASGRIEGDETIIAPKIAGQIITIYKDKGEQVRPRELLARLSSDQLTAQLSRVRDQAQYWQRRVQQAEVDLAYTRQNVEAVITESEARVGAMAARQLEAAALYEKNILDFNRYRALWERRVIAQKQFDEVKASYKVAAAQQTASRQELAQARAGLRQARLLSQTVDMKRAEWQAAQASLEAAQASIQEAEANLEDTKIHAPAHGVILTKEIEMGEVVNPGTPLFTIVDLNKLYLKVYINEPDIGKLRLGQEARIYVDAFPDKSFPAVISRVSQRAEFTPKYVETRQERVKLVFAVELRVENQEGFLKPGMPGDAVIRLKVDIPWQRPQ